MLGVNFVMIFPVIWRCLNGDYGTRCIHMLWWGLTLYVFLSDKFRSCNRLKCTRAVTALNAHKDCTHDFIIYNDICLNIKSFGAVTPLNALPHIYHAYLAISSCVAVVLDVIFPTICFINHYCAYISVKPTSVINIGKIPQDTDWRLCLH